MQTTRAPRPQQGNGSHRSLGHDISPSKRGRDHQGGGHDFRGHVMGIISWIILGLIAGFIASR